MKQFSSEIVERLATARRVAVLTGAGASAESGLPTFREADGLWDGIDPAQLASADGFRSDPVRVQSWYSARVAAALDVAPNPCHVGLARLEEIIPSLTVITQNVDGLHQRAGSNRVIELHGNLLRTFCMTCGRPASKLQVKPDDPEPARCACGGLIRPDVVWFGEALPQGAYEEAAEAAAHADVFLAIGTSGEVFPAAALPTLASENGAFVLEINVQPSALSAQADEIVLGRAGVLLPVLLEQVLRKMTIGID